MAKENILWVEKYRPKTVEDCILPEDIKKFFASQVKSKNVQNMLLTGSHGVGKTTIAKAMCEELGTDTMVLNCSKNNSIDDVRTKITSFSSSKSLLNNGKLKVFIGDEFDYFSPQGQGSLRGVIEEVSNNCRFIFTCNYPNKIIDPIKSRLDIVKFTINKKDIPLLASKFMKRCMYILDTEGVSYKKEAVALLIKKYFPDFRKVIKSLSRAAMVYGEINESILTDSDSSFSEYYKALKEKDYKAASKFIGESAFEPDELFSELFKDSYVLFTPESLAQGILIINEFQYNHAFVANPELNLSAMTIKLMATCGFK